jgi:hypothetical protein
MTLEDLQNQHNPIYTALDVAKIKEDTHQATVEEIVGIAEELIKANEDSEDFKCGEHWSTCGYPKALTDLIKAIKKEDLVYIHPPVGRYYMSWPTVNNKKPTIDGFPHPFGNPEGVYGAIKKDWDKQAHDTSETWEVGADDFERQG